MQLWIGGIRLKKLFKNHCTASLLTVITGFLVLVAVSVWGMGMYCLTSVTAEYAASRYLAGYGDFASTIAQRCFEPRLGKAGSSKYKNLEKVFSGRLWIRRRSRFLQRCPFHSR